MAAMTDLFIPEPIKRIGAWRIVLAVEAESINRIVDFTSGHVDLNRFKQKWEEIGYMYLNEQIMLNQIPCPILEKAPPLGYEPSPVEGEGPTIILDQQEKVMIATHIYSVLSRVRDESNYSLMHKAFEDAIVRLGLIPDDSAMFCRFGGIHMHDDPDAPRIEIHILKFSS